VTDPKGPTTGSAGVFRGGHSWDHGQLCRSAYRYYVMWPGIFGTDFGFRVVLATDS
jgi:hypothetical protein